MKHKYLWTCIILQVAVIANAQSIPYQVPSILSPPLQSRKVATYEVQEYVLKHAPQLPYPETAQQWTAQAERIRRHLLKDVIFHGWPERWVNSPSKFEDLGYIPSGKGYRLRKLRYEIVPGFYSTALLYEPAKLVGRVPAVLDVMGHFPVGKADEFEQKLCINQALQGMIALNLEWLDMGELQSEDNSHWFGGDLDLVGANGVGLFYLAMRRGLDYLSEDPNVDSTRIGMTGLSSGGWQTIVLGSLDPRVKVAIPVAGYGNIMERIARQTFSPTEPGDNEQLPTDFLDGQDYSTLTAMRAPRPTLLINNAEDTCCYRAPLVKPYIYDTIKPFFKLYGKENELQFYENTDIAAHNYGLSNREQAYHFLDSSFDLPVVRNEIPVGEDIKSYSELAVGIPKDNLTILGLARQMASEIRRSPLPTNATDRRTWEKSERSQLRSVVRYKPVKMERPWLEDDTRHNGAESISYRFEFSNGFSATGVWIRAIGTPENAPMTIMLNDKGKEAVGDEVWDRLPELADRVSRGEQVLVLNLVFTGDAAPNVPAFSLANLLRAIGDRPLGMEAAQLIGVARWAQHAWNPPQIRLESAGIRSQVESLVAAAIDPNLFSEVVVHGGMPSFSYLLKKPVKYFKAPDLFCLDLYKYFDLDRLALLAEPTLISHKDDLKLTAKQ
jgi:dienelactone hydrolase